MLTCTNRSLKGAVAAVVLLSGTVEAQAPSETSLRDKLEFAGLSVHTETARDIYLAGLLLRPGSQLDSPLQAPPPKAMEYRFATRRLSSRGFAGMLLLQAELGGNQRAPDNVLASLTVLKRQLKGSLKRGDQFIIVQTEADETVFLLNSIELHRVADGSVFDFFITGWVGQNAAATFRAPLLAGKLNETLRRRFEALIPSEQRIASINDWVAPDLFVEAAPARLTAVPDPDPQLQVANVSDAPTETQPRELLPEERQLAPIPEPLPADSLASTEPETTPKPAPVQEVAAALPVDTDLMIDDREYRRRFQDYVRDVMRLVYGEVKYPRRAIKYQWEGRVELSARLDESGELLGVVIDNSSGHARLDRAAEAAVKRAAPFPELTPVAREELSSDEVDGYVMSIPVTFALRR